MKTVSQTLDKSFDFGEDRAAPLLEKETRFAVVMYGGVSLAIYIYGVAKELYGMVRATARLDESNYLFTWGQLTDTERVYRKIGELLKTKFVVDILSGTSAGGINAIYLAKALANGQSIDGLKDIWLDQGDMSLLINDKQSETGLGGLKIQKTPSSLLNSQRMYFHLFKALHGMEAGPQLTKINGLSPFVDELDLNITATDIRGLPVTLPVSNARVRELRFKNVFRFHYSTTKAAGNISMNSEDVAEFSNDFKMLNNPFLAYAARCTSSFPFAFEPMRLDDVESVLKTADFKDDYRYLPGIWSRFYKDYQKSGDDFPQRAFGDGGYLDNKPFSYATETLLRRRADQLVDRKLIYIDPSPEHPDEILAGANERPDVIENVMAALFSTPRYEPIREDLERVLDRNKMIKHVNSIINNVDDMAKLGNQKFEKWQADPKLWAEKFFSDGDLVRKFGQGYATYHQLRVGDVLDNLSVSIARSFNWDESGKDEEYLSLLLDGWRRRYYATTANPGRVSENNILFRLDSSYRIRRVQFLLSRLNILLSAAMLVDNPDYDVNDPKIQLAIKLLSESNIKWNEVEKNSKKIVQNLKSAKVGLNDIYGLIRACGRKLRTQNLADTSQQEVDLKAYTEKLRSLKSSLEKVENKKNLEELAIKSDKYLHLSEASADTYLQNETSLSEVFEQIEGLLNTLSSIERNGYLGKNMDKASGELKKLLKQRASKQPNLVNKYLSYLWERFEYYDMLTFPITYGTEIGESNEVEIIRVSPEDAVHFINEGKTGRRKLAGIKLANFSALLNREWRENDMLWGRLDTVEIMFKEMLQGDDPQQYEANQQELKKILLMELLNQAGKSHDKKKIEALQEYGINPLEMALQGVLIEDLKPRDKSVFYQFVEGTLATREWKQEKQAVNKNSPELNNLIVKDRRLSQLEVEVTQMLSNNLGQLEDLKLQTSEELRSFKSTLSSQLSNIKEEREKIKKEKTRLTNQAFINNSEGDGEQQAKELNEWDKKEEASFINSFPALIKRDVKSRLWNIKNVDLTRYRQLLRHMSDERSLLDMFRYGYQINRNFEPESTVDISSRALDVTSKIVNGLAEKHPSFLNPSRIMAQITKVVVPIVQLAMPSSLLGSMFLRSWVWLAYTFTSIFVIAGNLSNIEWITKLGSTTLVSVFGIHMGVLLVRSVITKGFKSIRYWLALIFLIILVLAFFGLMYLGALQDKWAVVGYLVTKTVASNWYLNVRDYITLFISLF